MPDELDLTEIDMLLTDPHWTLDARLIHHMRQMREEIRRLRALVASEREHKDALRERLSIIRRYIDDLPQES